MPLLKHQLIFHPDIVSQFALDKPVTPYERRVGFSWYVCPARVAGEQEWLLVNIEFGYKRFFERHLAECGVQAGLPTEVADVGESPSDTLVIRVRGDSMTEAHIDYGDLLIVYTERNASVGDFVVAWMDGQFTLKELVMEQGRLALKAHKPAYPLIQPAGELVIVGVVVSITPKLKSCTSVCTS